MDAQPTWQEIELLSSLLALFRMAARVVGATNVVLEPLLRRSLTLLRMVASASALANVVGD
jgi:hypothetical protein